MSSYLESTLEAIQMNDYTAIVTIIILVYDYALTFSREIDYIWCRPWSRVTILFTIVRYVGLCWNIAYSLADSAFVPGPVKVCTALLLIGNWGYVLFLAAADFVMILRVYAIWNRSRAIFGILFFIYAAQTITCLVWNGVYANSNQNTSVTIVQVLNFTYCSFSFNRATFSVVYRTIPRFVLSVILLILAVVPTIKEAVETYRLTKHWQINQYMKLLVREGVLYFILTLLFNTLSVIRPESPTNLTLVLVTLSYSVSSVIIPRFIISIREWHDRDIWNRGQGIDTAFGIFPQFLASESVTVSVLAFTDVIPEEGQTTEGDAHDPEAIQLEVFGDGAGQV